MMVKQCCVLNCIYLQDLHLFIGIYFIYYISFIKIFQPQLANIQIIYKNKSKKNDIQSSI